MGINETDLLKKSLQSRKPNYSLERDYYCEADVYEADLQYIWYRSWIFAGHPVEIPQNGNYFTMDIGDISVIVYRLNDEIVSAVNELNAAIFCPDEYGTFTEEELKASQQLKKIHCEEVSGYLYVSLADTPDDFEAYRKLAEPYMRPHNVNNLKVAAQTSIVENGNWKLVMENNRECYHCASNHPELLITYPDVPTISGADDSGFPPDVEAHWKYCEDNKLPSKFVISEDGTYRVARMPLVKDFTSYTMSGYDAVSKRLEGLEGLRIGTLLMFYYPNTWNHFLADTVISFRVLPLDTDKTLVTTKWLVNKDAVEGVDYHLDELQHVWNMTNDQDRHLVEENQNGIYSPYYKPGPYSVVHEGGPAQFIDWYCQTLLKRLSAEDNHPTTEINSNGGSL